MARAQLFTECLSYFCSALDIAPLNPPTTAQKVLARTSTHEPALALLYALERSAPREAAALLGQNCCINQWYDSYLLARKPMVFDLQYLEPQHRVARYSPEGKELLSLRILGLRRSPSEALLFLSLRSLASLFPELGIPSPNRTEKSPSSDSRGCEISSDMSLPHVLNLLDYQLYQNFGEDIHIEDLLQASYRREFNSLLARLL